MSFFTFVISTLLLVIALGSCSVRLHAEKVEPGTEMRPNALKRNADISVGIVEDDFASEIYEGLPSVRRTKRLRTSSNGRRLEWMKQFPGRRSALYMEGQHSNDNTEERLQADFSPVEADITEAREDFRQNGSCNSLKQRSRLILLSSDGQLSDILTSSLRNSRFSGVETAPNNGSLRKVSKNALPRCFCSAGEEINVPELEEFLSDCGHDREALAKPMAVDSDKCRLGKVPLQESENGCKRKNWLLQAGPQPGDDRHGYVDDGLAADKRDILPAEALKQDCCPGDDEIARRSHMIFAGSHQQVLDAGEAITVSDGLQISTTEFYTLESDILLQESGFKKLKSSLETRNNGAPPVAVNYRGDGNSAPEDYMISSTSVSLESEPVFNRLVKASSAIRDLTVLLDAFGSRKQHVATSKLSGILHDEVGPMRRTSLLMGDLSTSEDASDVRRETSKFRTDQDLSVVVFQTASNATESKTFSSTKMKQPEITEIEEECKAATRDLSGSQPRGTHPSRSRSTLQESGPDLPLNTARREQEMDLLWQEYNDASTNESDKRHGEHDQGKYMRRRGGLTSESRKEIPQELMVTSVVGKDGSLEKQTASGKGGWQPKARDLFRRKSLLRFCRALKDCGLRHCIQRSKVES